jgi:hypothetical protein
MVVWYCAGFNSNRDTYLYVILCHEKGWVNQGGHYIQHRTGIYYITGALFFRRKDICATGDRHAAGIDRCIVIGGKKEKSGGGLMLD